MMALVPTSNGSGSSSNGNPGAEKVCGMLQEVRSSACVSPSFVTESYRRFAMNFAR